MRLFLLSLAAALLFSSAAAIAVPRPQAAAATNIVFPGKTNEDDSQQRGQPAQVVDTKDVREQGREKCE